MYFIDTSALLKAYVHEAGSAAVLDALARLEGFAAISDWVALEASAALARLSRTGELASGKYEMARGYLHDDCRSRFYVVHPSPAVVRASRALVHRYRDRSVGGMDLLHLATAEYLQKIDPAARVSLMCSDTRLAQIATERGFDVFDPTRDALDRLLLPRPS